MALRVMAHQGDKRYARRISVKALYKTFDRDQTLTNDGPVRGRPPKDKGKNKARPESLRRSSTILISSDPANDLDDVFSSFSASKTPKASVTKKQLAEKESRDLEDDSLIAINRRLIFKHYTCVEQGCHNRGRCCYVLKSEKTHHKISPTEQWEWAKALGANMPGVTVKTPPGA